MLTYMLDTNICIYVMKNYPLDLREKFNALAEQLCISSITLGELHYGAEKSARRAENLTAIEHFVPRLDVLPFADKAAAHYGQVRAELERARMPSGPHNMQIGGHARSEGLIIVTNNMRELARMPELEWRIGSEPWFARATSFRFMGITDEGSLVNWGTRQVI
jgi:tRNA(fMet)-specific endonuclease VapC